MAYRVLFISDISLSPFTTIADRMLIRGLRARDVDMTVVTQRPTPETQELEEEGVRVEYVIFDKKISRTIITHGSTQLAVLSMLIFGGEVLHYFALALTIGILFGIYSSVLVASPLVMWLGVSREQFVKPQKPKEEAVV